MLLLGFSLRPAVLPGRQHARLLDARERHRAVDDRVPVVGRPGVLAEVPVGAAASTSIDAPLFGRWLGRRRGWMMLAQLVGAALVGMASAWHWSTARRRRARPVAGVRRARAGGRVRSAPPRTSSIDAWRIESAPITPTSGRCCTSVSHAAAIAVALLVTDCADPDPRRACPAGRCRT